MGNARWPRLDANGQICEYDPPRAAARQRADVAEEPEEVRECYRKENPYPLGSRAWSQFEVADISRQIDAQCKGLAAHAKKLEDANKAAQEEHDRFLRSIGGRVLRFFFPWNPAFRLPSSEDQGRSEGAQETQGVVDGKEDGLRVPLVGQRTQDGTTRSGWPAGLEKDGKWI